MTREEKLALIQRMLGLKHKIKVHDSMAEPQTHDELSMSMLSRWELEDELKAIESLLELDRNENVQEKTKHIQQDYLSGHTPAKKKKF